MFDEKGLEHYLRGKLNLEARLTEVGDMPVSTEVEQQMRGIEERLLEDLKRAYRHAAQQMFSMQNIVNESLKRD